jgi:peptidoglycan/xylan/chitin deacetylase (PgdA/CDA1 family)
LGEEVSSREMSARAITRRPPRPIPEARSNAFRRARRRRHAARRIALCIALCLALVLGLLSFGAPFYGVPSSEGGYARAALPVEAGVLPDPPDPPPPDMGEVWAAARAKDRSPGLATRAKLSTSGGKIALTFDDGPDRRVTPLILDTLREHHVKATFFVVGSQVESHPGLLRRIVDEGHTIGNHTYDHSDMSYLSPEQMRLELQSTQKAVDKALGYHHQMKIMRPPYGEPSYFGGSDALPAFRRIVRQEQLFPVIWTIDTQDYLMAGNPRGIVRSVVRQDRSGRGKDRDQVVLMHDIHPQDAQALPEIIDHYEGSDRRFVSVEELLTDKYVGT